MHREKTIGRGKGGGGGWELEAVARMKGYSGKSPAVATAISWSSRVPLLSHHAVLGPSKLCLLPSHSGRALFIAVVSIMIVPAVETTDFWDGLELESTTRNCQLLSGPRSNRGCCESERQSPSPLVFACT